MRIKNIILLLFTVGSVVYAELPQANTKDINSTTKLQNSEILTLKKRIKKLESELEIYKQVKPIATKDLVAIKTMKNTKTNVNKKVLSGKSFTVRKTEPEYLTAYYVSNPQTLEDIKFKLEINGFDILAIDKIFENRTVISFTNEELKKTNSFLSVLHMLVSNNIEIRVQNPSYFAAAYLKDKFKYGQFMKTLKALDKVLGRMYETKDKLKLLDLSSYHFMLGMPYYDDTIVVARGDDIVQRLSDTNSTKHISYALRLANGSTLVGHKLNSATYDYLKKINVENNAQIFPYEVIIKNEKAIMLSPKFYLALSLPLLSMTDFLKIASVPDKIKKDIKIVYEKDTTASFKK
jgi:hypothetical protein